MKEIYLSFDWDPNKNKYNIHKHDVSFKEALTVKEESKKYFDFNGEKL